MAGDIALLTGDMLLHAVLRSGLLMASYIDEFGEKQPAGPLFVVQVRWQLMLYITVYIMMNWNNIHFLSIPASICSWRSPESSSCWDFWSLSSCCWRVMPSSTPSWLSSTRPLTSGTKAEVTSVSTVTQLQQIVCVIQHQTTPNDITTAEDFCKTWGRYFSLLYLLKKKTNKQRLCCIYYLYNEIYLLSMD